MKQILVPQPETQDDAQWVQQPLWKIILFQQPLAGLSHYVRSKAHNQFMEAQAPDFGALPPLQTSNTHFTDELELSIGNLENRYARRRNTDSLIRVVYDTFRSQILYYISIVQLCVVTKMAVSFMLSRTLHLVSLYMQLEPSVTMTVLLMNAFGLSILLVLQVLSEQHYFQNIYQMSVKVRLSLVALLYRKLTTTTGTRIKDVSDGQFFNLISMDLSEIDSGLTWFLALAGSFVVGVVVIFLCKTFSFFGLSSFIGVAVLVGINLISRKIVDSTTHNRGGKLNAQDERTQLTSEVLHNMRPLKMFALEKLYRDRIVQLRATQDKYGVKLLRIDALAQCLTGNISVFLSLLAIIFVHVRYAGGTLAVDKVFGTMWVLQLMKVWCLTYFYRGRRFWVNIKLVAARVTEILNVEDVLPPSRDLHKRKQVKGSNIAMVDEEAASEQELSESDDLQILLEDYTARWTLEGAPVLKSINFNLQNMKSDGGGFLVTIVGKCGTGKSTFLKALLGEIPYAEGQRMVKGSIAYVEQSPYIFSGTIRENILFGRPYDADRYQFALEGSCLSLDLQNKSDISQVGDKGSRLSGGQRARLSFARALYARSRIVLLDDILSAVDTRVARQMFQAGVMALRQEGATVIMVTHHLQWASLSDCLLMMEGGTITKEAIGPNAIQQLLTGDEVEEKEDTTPIENKEEEIECQLPPVIPKEVYRRYIQEAGGYKVLLVVVGMYLGDASLNMCISKLFGEWADQGQSYAAITVVLIVLYAATNYAKLIFLFERTLVAIGNMHRKLCTSTVRSQMQYFDSTPIGSILSRFTNDLNNIEGMVMLDSHWVLEGCIDNVFVIIVISLQNVGIVMAAIGILCWMFLVKGSFTNYMKYAVKCDDLTRGKMFDFIESSISGSTLIRTYGQQQFFQKSLLQLIYRNMQANFAFLRLNALLGFIFELSLHVLIIISLFLIMLFGVKERKEDADDLGFSLMMLLSLGYMFSLNLRGQIYLDIDMQNAHRVFKNIDVQGEGEFEYDNDFHVQLSAWPQQGGIQFRNVTITYRKTLMGTNRRTYALKNVSFKLAPGESIGVVGRTGAGKSSLFNAILRMVELESGTILIDDVDIDSVGIHTLREKLLVIPQQSPILSVSIRDNIDPKNQYSDQQIWNCLDRVGLERIKELPDRLDTIASDTMFSAGEKQLFSLCRIILHPKPRVLLFDEATANVDPHTDKVVQELIATSFDKVSKVIIAHRLATVMKCHRVIVMAQGEIVEFDTPKALLHESKVGLFRSMFDALDDTTKTQIEGELQG